MQEAFVLTQECRHIDPSFDQFFVRGRQRSKDGLFFDASSSNLLQQLDQSLLVALLSLDELREEAAKVRLDSSREYFLMQFPQSLFHLISDTDYLVGGLVAFYKLQVEGHRPRRCGCFPGVDSPLKLINGFESMMRQQLGGHSAASTHGAVDEDRLVRIQGLQRVRQSGQGNEFSTGQVSLFVFEGLTHIKERIGPFFVAIHVCFGFIGEQHLDFSGFIRLRHSQSSSQSLQSSQESPDISSKHLMIVASFQNPKTACPHPLRRIPHHQPHSLVIFGFQQPAPVLNMVVKPC